MRWMRVNFVVLSALCLTGCPFFRGPKVAVPAKETASQPAETRKASQSKARNPYQGRTPEQWGETLLNSNDRSMVIQASRALQVLGSEGRPYLVQALESPYPENRRVALEALSVADLRAYGEQGRRVLIKLAGDHGDFRIRERAGAYLMEWNQVAPNP